MRVRRAKGGAVWPKGRAVGERWDPLGHRGTCRRCVISNFFVDVGVVEADQIAGVDRQVGIEHLRADADRFPLGACAGPGFRVEARWMQHAQLEPTRSGGVFDPPAHDRAVARRRDDRPRKRSLGVVQGCRRGGPTRTAPSTGCRSSPSRPGRSRRRSTARLRQGPQAGKRGALRFGIDGISFISTPSVALKLRRENAPLGARVTSINPTPFRACLDSPIRCRVARRDGKPRRRRWR